MLLRQSLIYVMASLLVILFARYAHLLVVYIDLIFTHVNLKLSAVFSHSPMGVMIRKMLVLVALPLAITAVPALIYRAIKGHTMPHFIEVLWLVWLVVVLSNILIR